MSKRLMTANQEQSMKPSLSPIGGEYWSKRKALCAPGPALHSVSTYRWTRQGNRINRTLLGSKLRKLSKKTKLKPHEETIVSPLKLARPKKI
jgi:hypothetical protein